MTTKMATNRTAVTSCMDAVTRRLPMTRLPRAVIRSSEPHASAAPSPASSPKGMPGA